VLRDRHNLSLHIERLQWALELPGAEQAQGALADLFFDCPDAKADARQAALASVRARLSPSAGRWFDAYVSAPTFPTCSQMATRWSLLVMTSLDVPRRALRCSADDSRQLADAALEAWRGGDAATQEEFLDHCRVCRDTLAFMLARRAITRQGGALPPHWEAVCSLLQQAAPIP
jgi:hypothetical protein